MDTLDLAMREAERLGFGVSYGKYKAAYPNGSGDVITPAVKTDLDYEDDSRQCKLCGKTFTITHGNQRYCSADCSDQAKDNRIREYDLRRRKEKNACSPKFCKECGATITAKGRMSYCSEECAKEGTRKYNVEWARKKAGGQLDGKPVLKVACIHCGKEFQTQSSRRITCSPECASRRRREMTSKWHAKQKEQG